MDFTSSSVHSVLDLIGHTPLISLEKWMGVPCYAKMELLNPGGSIKDRIALAMLQDAIESKALKPGMTILEPTSGNTGIALAMVGHALGYPVTIVMPENMSLERQQMIKAFGASLVLTPANLSIGGAVREAERLYQQGHYYMPMQFGHPQNVKAQEKTAQEALKQIGRKVDILISGIGSGGTIQGMANILKQVNPDCRIIAVEPKGVSSLKGDPPGIHAIQGIGDGFVPALLDRQIITDIIEVSDEQAISMTKKLALETGIFAGISSGANLFGAKQAAQKYGHDQVILTVLADRGERYFSTGIYDFSR